MPPDTMRYKVDSISYWNSCQKILYLSLDTKKHQTNLESGTFYKLPGLLTIANDDGKVRWEARQRDCCR